MKYKKEVWISDAEMLVDILKNIMFAGFIAILIDFEISAVKVIITVIAVALTFPLRRIILKRKAEAHND